LCDLDLNRRASSLETGGMAVAKLVLGGLVLVLAVTLHGCGSGKHKDNNNNTTTTTTTQSNGTTETTTTGTTTNPFAPVVHRNLCTPREKLNCDDGDDLLNPEVAKDAGACCEKCQQTSGCNAWTYNSNTTVQKQVCYLKKDCHSQSRNNGTTSGFEDLCTQKVGIDCSTGEDLPNPTEAEDTQTCCNRCLATPGCNAWTWNANTGAKKHNCYLKKDCKHQKRNDDVISGYAPSPLVVNVV